MITVAARSIWEAIGTVVTAMSRERSIVTAMSRESPIAMSTRRMTPTNRVVDIQHNLSTNRQIKERSRITSKQLNLSLNLSANEEDKLHTITITSETAIAIDDPNDLKIFDDGDDLGIALRTK